MSNIEKYKGEGLPALMNSPEAVIQAIAENLGGASISESQLTKIKVPTGGATFFEIPSLTGATPEKELVGTLVFHRPGRAYFDRPFDQAGDDDRFPKCSSEDGLIGIGDPGGNCQTCHLAKFGTDVKANGQPGRGQACSERKTLYMIRGEQMIPDLVQVPATSIKPCIDFLFNLAKSGILYYKALIAIQLVRQQSADNIAYATLDFKYIRPLGETEVANATAWNAMMRKLAEDASANRRQIAQEAR